jgi:hypothetical protein
MSKIRTYPSALPSVYTPGLDEEVRIRNEKNFPRKNGLAYFTAASVTTKQVL